MHKVINAYEGELCFKCVHVSTGAQVMAESMVNGFGHNESFSPIDLLAAAIGSCALNTMGLYAHKHNLDFRGAEADVAITLEKSDITQIELTFRMPQPASAAKERLEDALRFCPVHKAVSANIPQKINFIWI